MIIKTNWFKLILALQIILLTNSCDKSYKISINEVYKKIVSFPCGKIESECRALGKRDFLLDQQFELNNPVIIHKDSLRVFYHNQIIPSIVKINDIQIQGSETIFSSDFKMSIKFYIPGGLGKNETIHITLKGFLVCRKTPIPLESIILSLDK